MKTHADISSSRRKSRKAHFSAPSHIRAKIMSSSLAKNLREEHKVRSLPIVKDDEVIVVRGTHKGKTGKVVEVYRKKWVIHIDKITSDKVNGATIPANVHPSNVVITKIKSTETRKKIFERKSEAQSQKENAMEQ